MRTTQRGLFFLLAFCAPGAALAQGLSPQQAQEIQTRVEAAVRMLDSGQCREAEVEFRRLNDEMAGQQHQGIVLGYLARSVDCVGGREREAMGLYADYLRRTDGMASDAAVRSNREWAQQRFDALQAQDTANNTPTTMSPIGPIVLAAGAVLIVGGLIVGAVTLVKHDEFLARCILPACPVGTEGQAAEINTLAIVTDVLVFVGAAVAVTGLILTLVLRDPVPSAQASLACGPNGCLALFGGRFR